MEQVTRMWNNDFTVQFPYFRLGTGPVFQLDRVEDFLSMVVPVFNSAVMYKQDLTGTQLVGKIKDGKRYEVIAVCEEFIEVSMDLRVTGYRYMWSDKMCAGNLLA